MSDKFLWSSNGEEYHDDKGEVIWEYIENSSQEHLDKFPTLKLYRGVRETISDHEITAYAEYVVENLLGNMDESHGPIDDRAEPTDDMQADAEKFVRSFIRKHYKVWSVREVGTEEVHLPSWIENNLWDR